MTLPAPILPGRPRVTSFNCRQPVGLNLPVAGLEEIVCALNRCGAPSQFETFDPKPGHANGGETKDIATSVAGIRIADNLPEDTTTISAGNRQEIIRKIAAFVADLSAAIRG